MSALVYLVVISGLTASLAVLGLVLARGRSAPMRTWPWVVALLILGVDTLVHVVASVGIVIAGGLEGAWFVIGSLGFVALLTVAVLHPRWAGWLLIGTAVGVPVMLGLGGLLVEDVASSTMPWQVAAVTYGVPAVVSGGLLLLASLPRRRPVEAPAPVEPPVGVGPG